MRYYCVKQHDMTDCGAVCLATIAKQNGYKISISKIREKEYIYRNMYDMMLGAKGIFPLRYL